MRNIEFVTSDWHLGHKRCAIEWRGFKSVQEHDNEIMLRYVATVNTIDNAKCCHVGDYTFNNDLWHPDNLIMIKGNHDKNKLTKITHMAINVEGHIVELVHNPLDSTRNTNYVIHGHIHKTGHREHLKSLKKIKDYLYYDRGSKICYYNVNVEFHDYKPVHIKQALGEMKKVIKDENKKL